MTQWYALFLISNLRLDLPVVLRLPEDISLSNACRSLVFKAESKAFLSFHHVYSYAGNVGNEFADIAAIFGTRSLISDFNSTARWLGDTFYISRLIKGGHFLSLVAEQLHGLRAQMQLEKPSSGCCVSYSLLFVAVFAPVAFVFQKWFSLLKPYSLHSRFLFMH